MLGPLRFFLASCVIACHLTQLLPNLGGLSLNFFYLISGYLITLVLNETYKFDFIRFTTNRFLRLYPTFYALTILALYLHIFTIGATGLSSFHMSWSGELQKWDFWGNALLFPWAILADNLVVVTPVNSFFYSDVLRYRLIPSAWSVGVEIICYGILWLFTARNLTLASVSFIAASLWHFWVFYSGTDIRLNYSPISAAMLPFSMGSIAYYLREKVKVSLPNSNIQQLTILIFIICAFSINWYISLNSHDLLKTPYYYLNNIIAFFAVFILHKSKPSNNLNYWCKWVGDLSYPMFLAHYLGAYIGWHILGTPTYNRGIAIFIIGYFISIALSILVVLIVDKPINKIRDLVRPASSTT